MAEPQPAGADGWVIGSDVHLGMRGRVEEVWRYRRIYAFFAIKAVRSLYANTTLGVWWLLIRPIAPVIVGALVFGQIMNAPSDGLPYFLFFLCGSTIWSCFTQPWMRGSRGIEANRSLLTKLYIPRVILPAGQLVAGLIFPLVLAGMFACTIWYYRVTAGVWYGVEPGRLPVAILAAVMAIALAFSLSLCTSVLQAWARDVRFLVTYVTGFWFLVTPVMYPLSAIPESFRWIALINPMTGPVEAFRWALLGVGTPAWGMLLASSGGIVVIFAVSLWVFTTTESAVVDSL